MVRILGGFAILLPLWVCAQSPPRSLDPTVQITLFAEAPRIVTPIGATVDAEGHLLVIESHSHFRPKDYSGPATDRIRKFDNAGNPTTFYEGQNFLMNLAAEPDGSILVSARNEIFRLSKTAQKTILAHLETKSDYPHNGLHGLATDAGGNIYLGIGENFGGAWTLHGSDESTVSNNTGSGAVMRMDSQGRGLVRLSRGFWNPFGLCVDPIGNIWAIDNDPDGRPPCRLIQVLPGADYGFEFRYGRTGLHPLQCWDGELPGTLPMVAGVGEAPCAVRWHRGKLLVSSWRDHVIQQITITPHGASYTGAVESLIAGGDDFRPVGLAEALDGSIFVTDWVANSYPVHGKGRIWKLIFSEKAAIAPAPITEAMTRAAVLRKSSDRSELLKALDDSDPFIAQAAQYSLSQQGNLQDIEFKSLSPQQRIGVLAAMLIRPTDATGATSIALGDADDRVRQMAIRVIAELDLTTLRPQVAQLLDSHALSPRLLAMTAATLSELDGDPAARIDPKKITAVLQSRLADPHAGDPARAVAMHMLLAAHPPIPLDQIAPLLHSSEPLELEAARYLSDDADPRRFKLLASLATDALAPSSVRAETIDGLAEDAAHQTDLLLSFADARDPILRHEALRSLRPVAKTLTVPQRARLTAIDAEKTQEDLDLIQTVLGQPLAPRPIETDLIAWQKILDESPGDPDAGRRIFFHPAGPGCFHCHMLEGRGHAIGPDLTMIGHSQSREHILESILEPSKEIAPLYLQWTIKTKSGSTIEGMLLRRDGQSNEVYVDASGKETHVKEADVTDRKMRRESLMPSGLVDGMTNQELRDLIALLTQKR